MYNTGKKNNIEFTKNNARCRVGGISTFKCSADVNNYTLGQSTATSYSVAYGSFYVVNPNGDEPILRVESGKNDNYIILGSEGAGDDFIRIKWGTEIYSLDLNVLNNLGALKLA